MDAVTGLAIGLLVGVSVVVIAFAAIDGRILRDCAREHSIYACEFVAVPKQPDEVRK